MKQRNLSLSNIEYWVFDMDGTLTNNIHDFSEVRQILDIPLNADILGHLSTLPEHQAKEKHAWLFDYECSKAKMSTAARGAIELVTYLKNNNCSLAVLTRNDKELANITLETIGLRDAFDDSVILGREQALPKPAPDGLLSIAKRWKILPSQLVMVGDYYYDMACGRNAQSYTVLINQGTNLYPELVDWFYPDCQAILDGLRLNT